jgi:hypothetical protein
MQMGGNADPRYDRALRFALQAHAAVRQERKGTDFPYVSHPIQVAGILSRFEFDADVVIAGFLHDTIEDTRVSIEELEREFGADVAQLVVAVSEPDKSLPWQARKNHTFERLGKETRPEVLALVAADKLDNVRAITDTLRHLGNKKTWALFNADRKSQHWYYRGIAELLLGKDPNSRLFRTLDYETQTLFPDNRHTTNLFAGKPLGTPHDARAYLADPIRHWRPHHSALELAHSWIGSNGIPHDVATVLATCPTYSGCRLIEGFFEREVPLDSYGRPSQTDLLALVALQHGYGVIAVEAKAREPFGPLVSDWKKDGSANKEARLQSLCAHLNVIPAKVAHLNYQLLHRTVSGLLEAQRYGVREALVLVQSFDAKHSSLDAYQAFAKALGADGAIVNGVTTPVLLTGVQLRLAWVSSATN